MSWVRIWVHVVFSTKNRIPFLKTRELRYKVFRHIKQNAEEKEVWLDSVNGYRDHAHCLIALGREQTLGKVVQLIKGESSYWINKNELTRHKFIWQDDYWAVSVSESDVSSLRNYIHHQEKHHKTRSFSEELSDFKNKYDWKD